MYLYDPALGEVRPMMRGMWFSHSLSSRKLALMESCW
jgi:hypothetical protein